MESAPTKNNRKSCVSYSLQFQWLPPPPSLFNKFLIFINTINHPSCSLLHRSSHNISATIATFSLEPSVDESSSLMVAIIFLNTWFSDLTD